MRIFVLLPLFFLLALFCLLRGALGQSTFDENSLVLSALGSGAAAPIFNAYFPSDPTSVVGASSTGLNYMWELTDPADNATVAAVHQGLVVLSGSPSAYIDVTTAVGANSCGQVLPLIGGPGSGSGSTQGWSVDMVVKLTRDGGWSKLIDFGDGPFSNDTPYTTLNDLTITWDGNDNDENGLMEGLAVQQLSSPPPATLYNFGVVPIIKPVIGQWYHIALVMQAVNVSAASATWYVYVNGAVLPYSTSLQSGVSLTAFQGANLPLPVVRNQSYIGKSDYGDPTIAAVFDAVRVYDYALTAGQVAAVAAVYNLNTGVFLPQPSNDATLPTTSETNYWQTAGISRAPVLNAVFPADPSSAIGTTRLYQWSATDSSDSSPVQALHAGVLQLTGSVNSFVDLTTPTGGNSVGLVMGVFGGAGSGTGSAQGWTVEMVVKPINNTAYSKLLSIGNGGYLDVLFVGWNSNGQNLYIEQTSNVNINLPGVIDQTDLTINQSIPLGQWLHLAIVLQPTNLTTYTGSMTVYLNGQLVLSSSDPTLITYPVPTYRDQTYIGASDYGDPNAQATYDAVRVYDTALTQTQVQAMATLYGLYPGSGGGSNTSVPTFNENTLVLAALGSGAAAPIFNAYFPSDPTSVVGASSTGLNYMWELTDPADNATVAAVHQGLVVLSGSPSAYIDVTTAVGANSCGQVLPLIGGPGSGSGSTQGWSVDMVVKLTRDGGWSKLIDFGDGPFSNDTPYTTLNDLTITWDGNDNDENGLMEGLAVQQLSSPPPATLYNFGVVPIIKPVIGQWYHIALVMQAVNVSAASATWYVYVNGAVLPYSTSLQSGVSLTAFQGANLPLPVVRNQSYIGKSDYGDPTIAAVFDAVRVYDYALTAGQVAAVAAVYNLNTGVFLPQPSNDATLPTTSETNYWQTAGISRAPVLNAVFPADPSSAIGTTRLYQWSATDSSDSSPVQALHAGVLQLTGSVNSFVDLTTPTGGNSVGLVMGVFGGAGSGTGSAQGWTVEMVVKPINNTAYSKLLSIGNGGYLDVLFVGWNSNGQNLYIEQTSNVNINLPGVIDQTDLTINQSIPLGQWLHLAIVLQPTNLTTYTGSMTVYLNGQLVLSSSDPTLITYPVPTYRDQTYIGASDYGDPNAQATYDAVRVYDTALTQTQVQAMATLYGLYPGSGGGSNTSVPTFNENTLVLAALGSGAAAPIFNAYFPSDPTSVVGASSTGLNYMWELTDPADNATVAAVHQGLVVLSGSPSAYIDVTTAVGANSCGQVLPLIGGPGSGSGSTQGWSVDMVVKLTRDGGWSKLIDFGDGPFSNDTPYTTLNDLTITWDGNDNDENGLMEGLAVQQLSSPPPATLYNFGVVPIIKPVIGQWYHIALVMQAVNVSAASATWYVYVNGAVLPYSTSLQSGVSLTAFQGANLPLPVVRNQSYIGKSDYGDPTIAAVFDAVRVYDYALTAGQVAAVAAVYNLNTGVFLPQPSNDATLPTTSETNYWQTAGISRAPVLNAVFPADPSSAIGTTRLYQWSATDSSDSSPVQALHAGVLQLTGSVNSFVDLTTPTGGNSVGLVMGVFGGAGSGTGSAQGWTVEMVVKPINNTAYSKLLSIGNGGYLDVLFVGWNSNGQNLYIEQTSNVNINLPGVIDQTDLTINQSIPLGQWLHLAIVLQPTNLTTYTGSMTVYLNGQLVLSSSDPTLITYPVPTYRDQTYIGASDYGDPNAQATYDAVRVYDTALTQTQVQAMATLYGLFNSSQAGTGGNGGGGGGSSGLSGGKIAGAVIGSVVGAVLLCALLLYFVLRSRDSGEGKTSAVPKPMNGRGTTYGEMNETSKSSQMVELA